MSAPRRSGRTNGCWTCKLRRKKCDELRPTCGNCDSLQIACKYGPKPNWMDDGALQREKTELLKNEIKRNAAYRREKANTTSKAAQNGSIHHFNVITSMMSSSGLSPSVPIDSAMSDDQTMTQGSNSSTSDGPAPFTLLPYDHLQLHCLRGLDQTSAVETDFIVKYLDFVFPALFPFYRPALFETGRSWLLLLLGKSKIAFHSAVSLSCYFFTMALTDTGSGEEHIDCKTLRWEEVEDQTKKCFDSIRTEMLALDLNSGNKPIKKLERVEILQSFMQVLIFELALGKSAPWNSHLPPAFALFEEIMASSGPLDQKQDQPKFYSVLMEIGQPLWAKGGQCGHIWSPEQAGFRFCTGLLIFIDVVASTATREPPRLLGYHSDVLGQVDESASNLGDAEVLLSSIVGCRNWVIRAIAEISALNSWKLKHLEANTLPIMELGNRASLIASGLRTGVLESQLCPIPSSSSRLFHSGPFDMRRNPFTSSTTTLIWAYAAQLYLTVVVSGWRLSDVEVRTNVAQIIELLQTVPPHQLRALAWPLCVAGCLALESEESAFLKLFLNQSSVNTAGALDDARQIMKQVWQIRATLTTNICWSLASCFSILGSPILLA